MGALETLALAKAATKLISVGLSLWTTHDGSGWKKEDAKKFGDALASVPELYALFVSSRTDNPLQTFCELTTVAFGEAWRRHWAYNEILAPSKPKTPFGNWLSSAATKRRLEQLEEVLRDARFFVSLGDGAAASELVFLTSMSDPTASPWYRSLWVAFTRASSSDAGAPTPMLLLNSGADRQQFERHFRLAFAEGLAAGRSETLRAWLDTRPCERARLLHAVLATRVAGFRDEDVFVSRAVESGVPRLPLQSIYVEPDARVLYASEPDRNDERCPVVELLERLLDSPDARLIVVLADFGRGKSLTARTLAYRMADRFLSEPRTSSGDLRYPIFVRCQESLRRNALNADAIVRAGQKRLAEPYFPK